MNKFLIFLFIISIYILSRKKKLYEQLTNNEKNTIKEIDNIEGITNIEENENYSEDECPYRLKKKLGKMCNQKWGQPDCRKWEKTENVKNLERKKMNVLKGYYSNNYMYEVDYENYPTILVDEGNIEEIDENTPRGIHSSFFS